MLPGLSIKILIHQLLQILRVSKVISYQFLTLAEKMNSFHRCLLYSFTGMLFEHAYVHNFDKALQKSSNTHTYLAFSLQLCLKVVEVQIFEMARLDTKQSGDSEKDSQINFLSIDGTTCKL